MSEKLDKNKTDNEQKEKALDNENTNKKSNNEEKTKTIENSDKKPNDNNEEKDSSADKKNKNKDENNENEEGRAIHKKKNNFVKASSDFFWEHGWWFIIAINLIGHFGKNPSEMFRNFFNSNESDGNMPDDFEKSQSNITNATVKAEEKINAQDERKKETYENITNFAYSNRTPSTSDYNEEFSKNLNQEGYNFKLEDDKSAHLYHNDNRIEIFGPDSEVAKSVKNAEPWYFKFGLGTGKIEVDQDISLALQDHYKNKESEVKTFDDIWKKVRQNPKNFNIDARIFSDEEIKNTYDKMSFSLINEKLKVKSDGIYFDNVRVIDAKAENEKELIEFFQQIGFKDDYLTDGKLFNVTNDKFEISKTALDKATQILNTAPNHTKYPLFERLMESYYLAQLLQNHNKEVIMADLRGRIKDFDTSWNASLQTIDQQQLGTHENLKNNLSLYILKNDSNSNMVKVLESPDELSKLMPILSEINSSKKDRQTFENIVNAYQGELPSGITKDTLKTMLNDLYPDKNPEFEKMIQLGHEGALRKVENRNLAEKRMGFEYNLKISYELNHGDNGNFVLSIKQGDNKYFNDIEISKSQLIDNAKDQKLMKILIDESYKPQDDPNYTLDSSIPSFAPQPSIFDKIRLNLNQGFIDKITLDTIDKAVLDAYIQQAGNEISIDKNLLNKVLRKNNLILLSPEAQFNLGVLLTLEESTKRSFIDADLNLSSKALELLDNIDKKSKQINLQNLVNELNKWGKEAGITQDQVKKIELALRNGHTKLHNSASLFNRISRLLSIHGIDKEKQNELLNKVFSSLDAQGMQLSKDIVLSRLGELNLPSDLKNIIKDTIEKSSDTLTTQTEYENLVTTALKNSGVSEEQQSFMLSKLCNNYDSIGEKRGNIIKETETALREIGLSEKEIKEVIDKQKIALETQNSTLKTTLNIIHKGDRESFRDRFSTHDKSDLDIIEAKSIATQSLSKQNFSFLAVNQGGYITLALYNSDGLFVENISRDYLMSNAQNPAETERLLNVAFAHADNTILNFTDRILNTLGSNQGEVIQDINIKLDTYQKNIEIEKKTLTETINSNENSLKESQQTPTAVSPQSQATNIDKSNNIIVNQ